MKGIKHFGWGVVHEGRPILSCDENKDKAEKFVETINEAFDGVDIKVVELFYKDGQP